MFFGQELLRRKRESLLFPIIAESHFHQVILDTEGTDLKTLDFLSNHRSQIDKILTNYKEELSNKELRMLHYLGYSY